jgi:tetratricopeptide (TPR) repeat protein
VPPTLQRIIGECLEKDPNDRYQHADQLAVDLRKLIRSTDADVRPSRTASWLDSAASRDSWLGRLRSPAHRRLVVGIVACLLLAAGFSIWQVLRSAPRFDNREGIILADFENRTGHAAFDTAVRDAFEQLLSLSTSVEVIRGDGLKSILGVRSEDRLPTLDRRTVERSCAGGKCAFIVGLIAPDGGSFRLRVDLFRPGSNTPIFSQSAAVRSEQDCLEVLHNIAIDLRRAAGEAPGAIALTTAPTTRSLAAFQAYASGELEAESGKPDVALGLHRRALAIDPEFVDAYTSLSYDYANVGEWQASRASAEQAYRRSLRLPEHRRLMAEILYLDTQYDHAREIELLKSYRRLYPYDQSAANLLGWLYTFALEDHVAAAPHFRAAYELRPTLLNLDMLTVSLVVRSKGDEIARVAQDYRRRTGQEPAQAILWALALGSDRKAMLQAVDRYERDGTLSRSQAADRRGWAHEKAGRLRDTLRMQEIVRREDLKQQGESNFGACRVMWLKMRLSRPAMLSPEELARAARSPLWLRFWAIVAVETKVAEPLATLIAKFEELERDTQSLFVHQELQFARGCLAFVRGDLKAARRLIEPLAENTEVPHRFHVLGRLYEAQRMWPEAATSTRPS